MTGDRFHDLRHMPFGRFDRRQLGFPGGLAAGNHVRFECFELSDDWFEVSIKRCHLPFELDQVTWHGCRDGCFAQAVKERVKAVVLVVRDRIVTVFVALGTSERHAEPHAGGCIGSIHRAFDAIFFIGRARFDVSQRIAMESGGDQLVVGWIVEQVTSELFDGELIKRQVAVQCFDNPMPIAPHVRAWSVSVITIAVGIASVV